MISYKDRTFCPFYEDCNRAKECHRPLTPEVKQAAEEWWGSPEAPIAMYLEKPDCHEGEVE